MWLVTKHLATVAGSLSQICIGAYHLSVLEKNCAQVCRAVPNVNLYNKDKISRFSVVVKSVVVPNRVMPLVEYGC